MHGHLNVKFVSFVISCRQAALKEEPGWIVESLASELSHRRHVSAESSKISYRSWWRSSLHNPSDYRWTSVLSLWILELSEQQLLFCVTLFVIHGVPLRNIKFGSWIKIDQLDVACFIISLFTAQHVSNVSTSIFRSLLLIVDLFHVLYCSGSMCVGVTVWFGLGGVVSLCWLRH